MRRASVVISNWNGLRLLKECLPGVIEAIKHSGVEHELIVIDDASQDDSVEFLKKEYPDEVRVIEMKENQGFAGVNNIGVAESKYDIVIPLNNDMIPNKDYFRYVLEHFDDEKVFAVSPKTIEEKGEDKPPKVRQSSGAKFKGGFWVDTERDSSPSLTALGGGMVVDKKKFMALGGFDKLYRPLYYEDTDLCYRAWKRGWTICYEPRAEIYHKCTATMRSFFSRRRVSLMKRKNYYLFMWRNITDRKLIIQHFLALPFFLLGKLLSGKWLWITAFSRAARQMPEAFRKRKQEKTEQVISDREIFDLFK